MENVPRNHEADIKNNSSEKELIALTEWIQRCQFDIVRSYSQRPLTEERIIFCTDPLLREVNKEAYGPNVVIIGPLCCIEQFSNDIQTQKLIYMDSFLKRAEKKASLKDFCKLIKDSADRINGCYEITHFRLYDRSRSHMKQAKPFSYNANSRPFIKMIAEDASFIIELFLRAYNKEWREERDFIFDGPGKMHNIRRDLFLAENQLPFFILKGLYELAFAGNPVFPSFLDLTCHFFRPYYNQHTSIQAPNGCHGRAKLKDAKHFTDLLRTLQLPSSKRPEESLEGGEVQGEYLYSAVLLREAGVKFKVSTNRCLLDIEFNRNSGELKIPPLRLDELTESFFRNLMAWEQRYYPHETLICDYIFVMEYLIQSTEDVDLLVRKRILINQLGSHKAVVTLFNKLCKHVAPMETNHYSDIFRKLNAYNAVRHHSWIAILKLQYFSTQWSGVATIAAIVLLVLTLIQTICAVISL
ncbi:UPF0481 protein At3g47200-like [Herrania umbratica]|uniref:UPF0481 protein At3g47200-like n=1 Tax=Herrania umbratica TaxID=108875 RepID=A0A6J1ALW1_9ROSI|nr:UPF0481 protein At3g47200-like [Herrania umbratica]